MNTVDGFPTTAPCRFFHRYTAWYRNGGFFKKHCVKCGCFKLDR